MDQVQRVSVGQRLRVSGCEPPPTSNVRRQCGARFDVEEDPAALPGLHGCLFDQAEEAYTLLDKQSDGKGVFLM